MNQQQFDVFKSKWKIPKKTKANIQKLIDCDLPFTVIVNEEFYKRDDCHTSSASISIKLTITDKIKSKDC